MLVCIGVVLHVHTAIHNSTNIEAREIAGRFVVSPVKKQSIGPQSEQKVLAKGLINKVHPSLLDQLFVDGLPDDFQYFSIESIDFVLSLLQAFKTARVERVREIKLFK